MKHTLVATMADGPAVLNRVVSLFRQRGFAIDSLTIGNTHEPHVMRLTIVVDGSHTAIEQVVKQLYKVIEVRKVSDLTEDQKVERELALIKVTTKSSTLRSEILQLVDVYRANIVDIAVSSVTVEVTGPTDKIDSMVSMLRPYGIKEMVRTGTVAMARGVMAGHEKGREAIRLREVS
ncbi:MAG: acetolactate synthase small subunit [Chloroflexi bacterium]|nr:acetolactate synthase small subunit [Chloroflexota bacterium]